jgi:HAE1 family hydrophobic/amphiphilic exporter-1
MYLRKLSGTVRILALAVLFAALVLQAPLALARTDGDEAKSRPGPAEKSTEKTKEKSAENSVADSAKKTEAESRTDSTAVTAGPTSAANAAEAGDSGTGIVQQPAQKDAPQSQITQPLALSPDVPPQRVGVDENQKLLLTMQDAVTMALQRNLDIEVFRQSVQISQSGLVAARGVYDLTSSSFVGYRSSISPITSQFIEGGTAGSVSNNSFTYNFSSFQEVERTAGRWQVNFSNSRATTDSLVQDFVTRYSPSLSLNYVQPILRDLSFDQNRRTVQLAKKSLDLSDSAFRQQVIEIISRVQGAYWDLVFAINNEAIARDSVELARVQLDNNRKMVEAGTLAPIELRSTEAALESRKGDVILALQGITTAENVLKGLLINDPNDKMWSSVLSPTDKPQEPTSNVSLDEAVRLALRNRPELEQTKLQIEQKEIDIRFFKNQLKPQVDLTVTYTNNGQAGTPAPAGPGSSRQPDSRFVGGYLKSLRNLFSQDFRTYEFGVVISFPWRNRTSEGALGQALAQSRQLDARQRQLVQGIQIEVRNALQAVEAARLRYQAQQANRLASEAQYKGEVERFRAGLQTNFFVLQRQTELSQALGAELRALTDYNKALAELQRVTGLTLVSNNVQVPSTTSDQNQKKDDKN